MDTNTVDIEITVTEDFWALVSRAAAVLNMTPEALVLEASVASALRHFPDRTDTTREGAAHRPT
jgi:hypothetical protein